MPNLDDPDLKDDREAFEARLAELGPAQVRHLQAIGAFPTGHNVVIDAWLGSQEGRTPPPPPTEDEA